LPFAILLFTIGILQMQVLYERLEKKRVWEIFGLKRVIIRRTYSFGIIKTILNGWSFMHEICDQKSVHLCCDNWSLHLGSCTCLLVLHCHFALSFRNLWIYVVIARSCQVHCYVCSLKVGSTIIIRGANWLHHFEGWCLSF
jgi:hypothetical protein